MNRPNLEKYMKVDEEKQADPTKPLAEICRNIGVPYQSYYLYKKRSTGAPPTSTHASNGHVAPSADVSHKIRVGVMVSIREIANLVGKPFSTIPVSVGDIVRGLTPKELDALHRELGRRQTEALKGDKIEGM